MKNIYIIESVSSKKTKLAIELNKNHFTNYLNLLKTLLIFDRSV